MNIWIKFRFKMFNYPPIQRWFRMYLLNKALSLSTARFTYSSSWLILLGPTLFCPSLLLTRFDILKIIESTLSSNYWLIYLTYLKSCSWLSFSSLVSFSIDFCQILFSLFFVYINWPLLIMILSEAFWSILKP